MEVTKIHPLIQIQQAPWLQPYFSKKRKLPASETSEMVKEFYKIKNNSISGKTSENRKKRSDIRLLADQLEFRKLFSKPQCQEVRLFKEFLLALNLNKVQMTINKRFNVGFAVLELRNLKRYKNLPRLFIIHVSLTILVSNAKNHRLVTGLFLYMFSYDLLKNRYCDKIRLLFSDTESLL